jgi:recombination protein RecT
MGRKPDALVKRDTMTNFLERLTPKLADVCTAHMQPERLARVFLAATARSPAILDCSKESTANALLLCSQLGLEPNTPAGHVYLIPYGKELQAQIGYKGLLELVRRTGQVLRVNAQVFYRQEVESGAIKVSLEPPTVEHEWTGAEYGSEDIAGAYCVIHTRNGAVYQEIMGRSDIEKTRKRNPAVAKGARSAWDTDYDRMARKSVIKRLINGGSVPISAEMLTSSGLAVALDHEQSELGAEQGTRATRTVEAFAREVEAGEEEGGADD